MKSLKVFSLLTVPLILFTKFIISYFSIKPRKNGNNIKHLIAPLMFIAVLIGGVNISSLHADNNSINGTCPGEIIEEIDGTTTNASHTENGAISGGGNDRYRMTFPVAGVLNISATNRNASRNENYRFYVSDTSCGNWNVVNGHYGRTHSATVSVDAGDTVTVRLQSIKSEPHNGRQHYALSLSFTAASTPPVMNPIPNQTGTQGSAFSLDISSYVTQTEGDTITSYALTGALPQGMSFNTSSGLFDGTPERTGTFNYSVTADDDDGTSNSENFSLTVSYPAVSCTPLKDSDNLTSSHTSYSTSSHYNNSNWNVGPLATSYNRAYHFTVDGPGTVDIDLTRIDQNQANFSVSQSSCPTTRDGLTSSQLTFAAAGDFYVYIYYIDGTRNNIEHQLDVVFTPTHTCNGCDCSLDTSANDSSPGATIPDLDGATGNVTKCISGESENNDRDYYNFTVAIAGTINITTSSPNSHNNHFEVKSSVNGTLYTYDTGQDRSLSYDLAAGERIVILIKETGSDLDEYEINFDFSIDNINAVDDNFNTQVNVSKDANVLVNDAGAEITVTSNTDPSNGTLIMHSDGNFTYTPNQNFSGTDTFTYTITDNGGNTDTATVTIDVGTLFTSGSELDFYLVNPDYARNLIGNYKIAGNTVLCLTEKTDGYGGTCHGMNDYQNITSNMHVVKYLDIDSDAGTWNSTSSYINFPATYNPSRGVIWAGLFWGGRISTDDNHPIRYGVENGSSFDLVECGEDSGYGSLDITTTGATTIKLDIDGAGYSDVQAASFHVSSSGGGQTYAAFADVSSVLQSANLQQGKHVFTVANLTTMEGRENSPGAFGGWSLVVIYAENYTFGKPRNISIYNGFISINKHNDPIEISGFKLPGSGQVNAKLSVFSGEGEHLYGYRSGHTDKADWIKISNSLSGTYEYMPGLTAGTHVGNRDNSFNGKLEGVLRDNIPGEFNNLAINNVGVDVDVYDVSDPMTTYRQNNAAIDTVYIKMYSDWDYITASMMAFSAELYVPELCYDYTLDIGGYVVPSTNNNIRTSFGNFGVPLTTHAYIRSLEGDIDLYDVNITYHIADTNQLAYTYNNCSTEISENGVYNYSNACQWTYDQMASGFGMYIGTGKTSTSGGKIAALEERYIKWDSDFVRRNVDTSFTFSIDYTVNYGSGAVPLHKNFTSADLCPAAGGGGFNPTYGIFNIVDGGAPDQDQYNLYTQVSGRPFSLSIYAHDKTNLTDPVANDLNISVEVEFIRADHFGRDASVSCNDEHSALPELTSKFVHIDGKSAGITYAPSDVNFAYRSLAMRVWYLTNPDGSLTDDHNCTRNDQAACELLYSRSFAAAHECDSECGIGGNGCYECLRSYHGEKSCSRDNFAIRPESFVTNLIDSAESDNIDNPSKSVVYSRLSTPGNVVAGYKYRFDINATNHVNDRATSRYIQNYTTNSAGHLAQMVWSPNGHNVSNCNDVTDKNISVDMFNGSTVNYHTRTSLVDKVDQIGKYQFIISDQNWTSADWAPNEILHHSSNPTISNVSQYFTSGHDCASGSAVPSSGTPGCTISSSHTNIDTGAVYNNLDMVYHPYKFDVSGLSIGIGQANRNGVNVKDFIYMNNPGANDRNMSFNIYGTYKALGYGDVEVSNFVENCYAMRTNMGLLQHSSANTPLYYYLVDHNTTNPTPADRQTSGIFTSVDNQLNIIQEPEDYKQDMRGAITMDLGYNYSRSVSQPVNPRLIKFKDFNITYYSNPSISVNLINDHKIYGNIDIDSNITFIYGRAHAPRYRVECTAAGACSNSNKPALIYYEFYSNPNAADANLSLRQTIAGDTDRSSDALLWFNNPQHAVNDDGNITGSSQKIASEITQVSIDNSASPTSIVYQYSGNSGYPYKGTIGLNTQSWLIYNKFNASATQNEFEIEFNKDKGEVAGHDTNATGGNSANTNTARRIRW